MAEYKKQAQTAPKQSAPKQSSQTAQTPVIRAKIDSLVNDEESKVKAYASVTIGGMFAVHGVRVYRTQQGGNYVSMSAATTGRSGKFSRAKATRSTASPIPSAHRRRSTRWSTTRPPWMFWKPLFTT